MSTVLVLSPDYQPLSYLPLSTISWQQAIKLFFLNKVSVLEWYDDWVVRSAKLSMRVPAVIVTKGSLRQKGMMRFTRTNLYLRDLYQCQYCGDTYDTDELTIDHVVPRMRGGKTSWLNCVTCCKECNSAKGHDSANPIRKPFKPDYWNLVSSAKKTGIPIKHPSWAHYLGIEERAIVNKS